MRRWWIFAVAAVTAVAFETSDLRLLLTLHELGSVYPSLVAVLVVFVSLFAPRAAALWGAWSVGLLLDLAQPLESGILVGPYALGFVFAAYVIVQIRTMVFRRRVLTLALLTIVCVIVSGLIETMLLTVRSWSWLWFDDRTLADFRPLVELVRRLGIAVLSALLAIPAGWLLLQTLPWWGFEYSADRRRSWR